MASLTAIQSNFLDWVRRQAYSDSVYTHLKQQVLDGLIRGYWVEGNLMYARGGRLYVPNGGGLKQELL